MARVNSNVLSHEPKTKPSQFGFRKNELNPTRIVNPTQPNPYSSNWVGSSCRVEFTPLTETRGATPHAGQLLNLAMWFHVPLKKMYSGTNLTRSHWI